MPIESWILPVLWREHDWGAALERLASGLSNVPANPQSRRAATELGRAFEYIEPDRRRAIATYELAGRGGDSSRARELAIELGWWSARARLSLAARALDPDPRLAHDEAEAWWDAGDPELCALALGSLHGDERTVRTETLFALATGSDRVRHAAACVERAGVATGKEAADEYVMAARFAGAAGRDAERVRWLEAALAEVPGHGIASRLLLALALRSRDPEQVHRHLQVRCEGLDPTGWIDAMRTCALSLIGSEHHRGFGLRMLRQALERAYELHHTTIQGHLAMWSTLAAHAAADGARRELLPLAILAIESTQHPIDHVWLGVLATEISLRDAGNPVVAGAYAEIVAEHAPEHPIVRELVAMVASAPIEAAADRAGAAVVPDQRAVPPAAVTAAALVQSESSFDIDIDVDLGGVYAEATEAAMLDASDLEDEPEDDGARAPAANPAPAAATATPVATPAPLAPSTPRPAALPRSSAPAKPTASAPSSPAAAPLASTKPADHQKLGAASATARPALAAKPAGSPSASKPTASSIVPASLAKPDTGSRLGASSSRAPDAATIKPRVLAPSANLPATGPGVVLAALRTPDRPAIPPRLADPPDAAPRARRIAIPIDVRLVRANGSCVAAHCRDVSTSGLFVLTEATFAIGDTLDVELLLPGKEAFTEDEYRSRARVARVAKGGYGIELEAPDPRLIAALAEL